MNFSPELKKKIDELGLKKENILFLTIQRDPLNRILAGSKTVEFRELSNYYIKKLCVMKDGVDVADKPITHILFQNGYSMTVPRALVEFETYFGKYSHNDDIKENDSLTLRALREAEIEGFEPEDQYIAIFLGEPVFVENLNLQRRK